MHEPPVYTDRYKCYKNLEMFRYPFSLPDTDSDTLAQGIGRYRVLIRYLGVYLYIQLYVLLALYELIRVIYGVLQTNPLIKHEQIHSELEYFIIWHTFDSNIIYFS